MIITDMEGDAVGTCEDCEAYYESMGFPKPDCKKCATYEKQQGDQR